MTLAPDHAVPVPVDVDVPVLPRPRPERFEFVSALRAVGALMVVWCHFVGPGTIAGTPWAPGELVHASLTEPFGITQNFGFLGVCVFFLISGFIISHVLGRETRREFGTKRIARIYPPLIAAILLTLAVEQLLRPALGLDPGVSAPDVGQFLRALTLSNFVYVDQHPIVAVAWTLIIEMLFYGACFVLLPLLRSRPRVAVVALLGSIVAVRAIEQVLPVGMADNWHLLAIWMSYLPVLVLGQIRYLAWAKRIDLRSALVLSALAAGLFVHGSQSILEAFYAPTLPVVSVAYAYAIFVGGMALGERLWFPRPLQFIATISYSLYLVHLPVGRTVEDYLVAQLELPATVGFLAALAISILTAWILWKLVEHPFQRLVRPRSRRAETAKLLEPMTTHPEPSR